MTVTALTLSSSLRTPRSPGVVRRICDVLALTGRNIVHIAREPLQLSDVTVQPVLFTLLFVYVFGAGVVLPGGQSYADFAIAGLLAFSLTTSAMGTGVGLSTDLNSGVIDRFGTLPMWTAGRAGESLDNRPAHVVSVRPHRGHHRTVPRLASHGRGGFDRRRVRHLPALRLRPLVGMRLSRPSQQGP